VSFQICVFLKKKKNPVNKDQGWEHIQQKYKANENTIRHNLKRKQKQTINKNQPQEKTKANNQQKSTTRENKSKQSTKIR
jgi:hypothetical protein